MSIFDDMTTKLGLAFGVLAQSDTRQLTVVARNGDVAVGDLFLMPSRRGGRERFYVFRTSEYANVLNRAIDIGDVACWRRLNFDHLCRLNLDQGLLLV